MEKEAERLKAPARAELFPVAEAEPPPTSTSPGAPTVTTLFVWYRSRPARRALARAWLLEKPLPSTTFFHKTNFMADASCDGRRELSVRFPRKAWGHLVAAEVGSRLPDLPNPRLDHPPHRTSSSPRAKAPPPTSTRARRRSPTSAPRSSIRPKLGCSSSRRGPGISTGTSTSKPNESCSRPSSAESRSWSSNKIGFRGATRSSGFRSRCAPRTLGATLSIPMGRWASHDSHRGNPFPTFPPLRRLDRLRQRRRGPTKARQGGDRHRGRPPHAAQPHPRLRARIVGIARVHRQPGGRSSSSTPAPKATFTPRPFSRLPERPRYPIHRRSAR